VSKSTAAVFMISQAKLGPWGDDAWRFSAAIQIVSDGPDWLYAQWPNTDGLVDASVTVGRFASLVLRDDVKGRADDIVAMAFVLMQVDGWEALIPWWDHDADRHDHSTVLARLQAENEGRYKIAVVQTIRDAVELKLLAELRSAGFEVVMFAPAD
jgi:hypothetical protein